jgi:hypothetical protein
MPFNVRRFLAWTFAEVIGVVVVIFDRIGWPW